MGKTEGDFLKMETAKNYTATFLIIISIIVAVDFIIKLIIVNTLQQHEEVVVINNVFSIIRIHNIKLALRLQGGYWMVDIVRFTFHAALLLLTIIIQKRNVHKLYKYSTVMIVGGWIGNYMDRFLLAQGDSSYIQMDYLYFFMSGPVFNLSTTIISIGWVLLIISVIIRFRDLKLIFSRQ